jgi:hypothetical protein
VAARLPAQIEVIPQHFVDHVLISNSSPDHTSPGSLNCRIEARVAHDRRDQRFMFESSLSEHIQCGDHQDVIAIDQTAVLVAEEKAIRITIVGKTDMRLVLLHLVANVM